LSQYDREAVVEPAIDRATVAGPEGRNVVPKPVQEEPASVEEIQWEDELETELQEIEREIRWLSNNLAE
jgi:hypothetical protein